MPKTDEKTIGTLADEHAATQGVEGRQFSYKLDGVVARRDAPATLLDGAAVQELVEVTDWQYPETKVADV